MPEAAARAHLRRAARALVLGAHVLAGLTLAAWQRARHGRDWHRRPGGRALIRGWARRVCRGLGLELRPVGEPAAGPGLLVANHISWLDILAIAAVAPARFVAKHEVRTWPAIGTLAGLSGTIFLDRSRTSALRAVLAHLSAALRAGERVAIFPEATTSRGDTVREFRGALFQAARQARCPVQPLALRYLRDGASDPLAPFVDDEGFVPHLLKILGVRSTRVELRFGPPALSPEADRRTLARHAHTQVRALLAACGPDAAAPAEGGR